MAKEYWIECKGKVSGPYSAEQLVQMGTAGGLSGDDLVSADKQSWKSASEVRGLLPARSSPPGQPPAEQSLYPEAPAPVGGPSWPTAAAAASPQRRKRPIVILVAAVVIVGCAAVGVYLLMGGKVDAVMKYAPPDTFAVVHVDVAALVEAVFEEAEKHKDELPDPDIDLGKIRDFCEKVESIDLFAAGAGGGQPVSMLVVIRGTLEMDDVRGFVRSLGGPELPLKSADNGRYEPDWSRGGFALPLWVIFGSEADDLPKGVILAGMGETLTASAIKKLGSGDNTAIRDLLDKVDTGAPIWAAGELPEGIAAEGARSMAGSVDPLAKGESRIVLAFRNTHSAKEFEKNFREMQKAFGDIFEFHRDGLNVILTAKKEQGLIAEAFAGMAKARRRAQRVVSMANLRIIGMACYMFAHDHDGFYPDDLAALFGERSYLAAECVFSPSTGRPPRLGGSDKPVPPFDYVYLASSKCNVRGVTEPSKLMIAYERPEINNNEGTHVVMADGSVRWIPMTEFESLLARSERLLKEQEQEHP